MFLLLIIILFILVCKRPDEKPRHGSNSLNSRSGWTGGPAPVQVPPGVWTTNPSMHALRQQQHMMLRQSPKLAHHPSHHANGYANRKPQPLTDSSRPKRTAAPPRPKDVKSGQRSRPQHPTRDKTVREMTMKLEDDERFPQQQSCGIRTSVGIKGDGPAGTAAARIYRSEPCLEGALPEDPHIAKIYSDYSNQQASCGESRGQTNKDVARAFRSCADVSRSKAGPDRRSKDGEEDAATSPIYATPHDAITQSDWVLDHGYQSAVSRSTSHVSPSSLNVVGGRNPYGRGVFMRPSDAAQYAHKRPQNDSSQTPIPTQILMFQHLQQQEQLGTTHSSTERASRTEAVLRPVSRSRSDASDIRHFAPENDPDAIYTQPMKLKRRSVESKGTSSYIAEESVSLPDGKSPRDSTTSRPLAPLSPIDEGANQVTVHAVIENHDDHTPEQPDLRTPSPEQPSPRSASPARAQSPDRLSGILPHDGRVSRRRSVDELTTMSEKHHQGEVMDAFRFLEDFDDAALSAKE